MYLQLYQSRRRMLPRPYYTDQDIRKRQIDTLKVFNDHVTEVHENSEYSVEFIANGKNMSLSVILTPEFPNEQPNIYIHPPVLHPWVSENSNQVTSAPGLVNFTLHSDLGRLVQAIIREFQRYLPTSSDEGTSNDASPQKNYSTHSLMFPEL
ncbi:putative Parcxpwfx02, partial [Operophtera brumata]